MLELSKMQKDNKTVNHAHRDSFPIQQDFQFVTHVNLDLINHNQNQLIVHYVIWEHSQMEQLKLNALLVLKVLIQTFLDWLNV